MDLERLKNKIASVCDYSEDFSVEAYSCDALEVHRSGKSVKIGYSSISDYCRGISLAIQSFREGKELFSVRQEPVFKSTGVMLDMSSFGLLSVTGVKKYIDYMAAAGLNMLMLYTEDTYEVKKYPQMGYLRGKYTQEELREIDIYAAEMGVELIGCIQTFGHLGEVVKWADFSDIAENDHLLLPGEERTYEYIEECIKTIAQNIRSRRIHIGMDETFGLCEGYSPYCRKHGKQDPLTVYTAHVVRVHQICEKYDLEPMMWSDCFFRYSMRETGYGLQYSATEPIAPEILAQVPKNMGMVYWQYGSADKEEYSGIIKAHRVFGGETIMASACWNWDGQLPNLKKAMAVQCAALDASKECGLQTVMTTLWQVGQPSDYFFSLHAVMLLAQYRYGDDTSLEAVGKLLHNCTGMEMAALEAMNVYHTDHYYDGERHFICNTLINTIGNTKDNPEERFAQGAATLRQLTSKRWNDHYTLATLILEVASIKAGIYNRLQHAYKTNNRDYLEKLVNQILPELIHKLKETLSCRKKLWFQTQKAFGFNGIIRHYGTAIADAEYTKSRIEDYLNGTYSTIEELEEPVMPYAKASPEVDYTKI